MGQMTSKRSGLTEGVLERWLELQAKWFAIPTDPATARKTKGYPR
jgi:hypothetical protein